MTEKPKFELHHNMVCFAVPQQYVGNWSKVALPFENITCISVNDDDVGMLYGSWYDGDSYRLCPDNVYDDEQSNCTEKEMRAFVEAYKKYYLEPFHWYSDEKDND